jgi:DNA polymerase III delta prime subunit
MDKIRSTSIIKILKTIAAKEKVKISNEVFEQLVSDGDVRNSITNLQIYIISGLIIDGKKESGISPFELIDTIFKTDDPFSLEGIIEKTGMNPEEAILWIEENIKYRYKGL